MVLGINIELFFHLALNGVLMGFIYALAAMGLSLIWGVMRIVNIAHGDILMISAFVTYWLFVLVNVNPFLSLVVTAPMGFVLGLGIFRFLVNRIMIRDDYDVMSLVLMLGLQTIIFGYASLQWGSDVRSFPTLLPSLSLGTVIIPLTRLTTSIIALILVVLIYIFLTRTYTGKAVRAVTQSINAAMAVGIDPKKTFMLSFGIGTALATTAGTLIAITNPAISPLMGLDFLFRTFAVVVLGGLGNPVGALLGGIILGMAESVFLTFFPANITIAVAFILIILILVLKPSGLLGAMR